MRALIYGIAIALGLLATPLAATEQTVSFEYLGLKPGMTVDQVKKAIENGKLGTPKIWSAPSLDQRMAGAFSGVQRILADTPTQKIETIFVPLPGGSITAKVSISLFSGSEQTLHDTLTAKYGPPRLQSDLSWVWGDDASLDVMRTEAYLEVRPRPATIGTKKPVAIILIGDPAIEKSAKVFFEKESRP